MKLYSLGHSEFIVEIQNRNRQTVRILNDVWLSNYAFGDFMQRNPVWDWSKDFLGRLDFIYISHPHCDHFDPYTLYWIYKHQNPDIILPENMLMFYDLIKQYLPKTNIIILPNKKKIILKELDFYGVTFSPKYETNEKDVMTLFISNEEEIIFIEEDCAIPEDPESYNLLYETLKVKHYKNRVYIAVRNELEGFYISTDEEVIQKRKEKLSHYIQKRKNEIEWDLYKYLEDESLKNIYKLNYLTKIYVGQGMIYPVNPFKKLLDISFPFTLKQIVSIEKKYVKQYQYQYNVISTEPGVLYQIEKGLLKHSELKIKSFEYYFKNYNDILFKKQIRNRPVFNEKRDITKQKILINKLLERLYYYLTSNPEIPINELYRNQYTIQILFGIEEDFQSIAFQLQYEHYGFKELLVDQNIKNIQEVYWANDLEDYYNGRLDQFSSVLLDLSSFKTFYLWTMMGLPYLNQDVVKNKLSFHFKNAFSGNKVDDYVLPILKEKITII